MKHIPIFLKETKEILVFKPDEIYFNLTLGYGGHAKSILRRLNKFGKLIAFDIDEDDIKNNSKLLKKFSNLVIIYCKYIFLDSELKKKALSS